MSEAGKGIDSAELASEVPPDAGEGKPDVASPPPSVEDAPSDNRAAPEPELAAAAAEPSPSTSPEVLPLRPSIPKVLELPLATLDGPSVSICPTPSPLPRVSLAPATGVFEPAAIPSQPLSSARNVPTVAARHVNAPPRVPVLAHGAPAMTFPPGRALLRDSQLAQRLVLDVRSSKREIVFGLSIGMVLAAGLGFAGQHYLEQRHLGQGHLGQGHLGQGHLGQGARISSAALPQTAERGATVSETHALQPRAIPADPGAGWDEEEPLGHAGAASREASVQPIGSASSQLATTYSAERQGRVTVRPSDEARSEDENRAASTRTKSSATSKWKKRRAAGRTPQASDPAPIVSAASDDPFVEPRARGDVWSESPERPGKSSLTPAESAGLGLDLAL